jgi:hypothetical protein
MRFFLKLVLFVVVAAVLGLVGFAIFSDLPPPEREVTLPVESQ